MTDRLEATFVEDIPDVLEGGRLYVSFEHSTALHLCPCGCGSEIVTPLGPTDWHLVFDGKVSLSPSIGNWALPCRSHYWINREHVEWAVTWDDKRVDRGREHDRLVKERFYAEQERPVSPIESPVPASRWWRTLWRRLISGGITNRRGGIG